MGIPYLERHSLYQNRDQFPSICITNPDNKDNQIIVDYMSIRRKSFGSMLIWQGVLLSRNKLMNNYPYLILYREQIISVKLAAVTSIIWQHNKE